MQSYYRYVSDGERLFIEENNFVRSFWGVTWFAIAPPSLYFTSAEVSEHLAMSDDRKWRFGPFPDDEAPPWDAVPPRTVVPQQLEDGRWCIGGGTECATHQPLWLVGFHQLQ
jgi:hypothetical protein